MLCNFALRCLLRFIVAAYSTSINISKVVHFHRNIHQKHQICLREKILFGVIEQKFMFYWGNVRKTKRVLEY